MRKTNWILAANVALAIGTTSLYGYGKWKEHGIHQAHEREVQQMVDRFKACPDRFRETGECYSTQEREATARRAADSRNAGRYLEAGMDFARLGREYERDAREMAGRCDDSGRRAIIEQIELRQEAGRRASTQ